MSANPVYDAVLQDLKIDPERIAARPAWSMEAAERARQHENKRQLRSSARQQRAPRASEVEAPRRASGTTGPVPREAERPVAAT